MANADRPRGAEPFGEVSRALRVTAGAQVFPGDFVIMETDGDVIAASADGLIMGVALSHAAADGDDLLISIDPEQLYVIQASGTEVSADTEIGNTADILATSGNTTYDTSRMELNSATLGASQDILIVGIDLRSDNAFGAQVDCKIKINTKQIFGVDNSAGLQ